MASGSASRAEELPPALPVKQHRSHSFSRPSMESDCGLLSPDRLQPQNFANNDVFPEPTDCHAAQCPIHQRYDPSRHQERFYSDGTPPPVPKKRLARTLSLPGTGPPPLSPRSPPSPPQMCPQNFDNPLYMLAPIPNSYFQEAEEARPAARSPVPLLSFSQLSFDTPDEHLPYLFSSFDDQRVVSQGIQHRQLLFLRSMAQSVEAGILLHREALEKDVSSHQPQDFLLNEGSQPKQVGDTLYYSLRSPQFPGRVLGLRVHRQTDEAAPAHAKHQPSHANVQNVLAHFQPGSLPRNHPAASQAQDQSSPFKSHCTSAKPPGGGSTEGAAKISPPSVESLLQRGHPVSVERDLPVVTLEDFVRDSSSLQSIDCLFYDRQVCVLLLQVLIGSQHLYNNATAAELRPREILLVWPGAERDGGENKTGQDASETKTRFKGSRLKEETLWGKAEKKGGIQKLWREQGSPRVVLRSRPSALSATLSLTSIKSQIGALIQYCLAPQEGSTSLDSGPSLPKSSYRRGLLHLFSLLQSGSSGPQIADMVATLQVLLWGPPFLLFNDRGSTNTAVHNWLTIKRALLVMKLAERGLIQDQSALDWEVCMCLQYLSFADPETVVSVTSQLTSIVSASPS